jgi:hypothetical protein
MHSGRVGVRGGGGGCSVAAQLRRHPAGVGSLGEQAMADSDVPLGIDRARHRDLTGRNRHVWWRRAALIVLVALPVLGLADVFGQAASPRTTAAGASLLVSSPGRVRGGLVFTSEFVITPRRTLGNAQLYLDNGWFRGMTMNALAPQPVSQTAQGRWQVLGFGKLAAGVRFTVWIAWQVNPTDPGRRSQDVALFDGGSKLMTIRRTITVFP